LEVKGLALLYPALNGMFVFLAIMDIRAPALILGKALEGRSDHQFGGATATRFSISSFQLANVGEKAE
jgi:hypothetical protein